VSEFLHGKEVAEILGVERHRIPRLVENGLLSVRAIPNVRRRFLRSEVEDLATKMVRKGGAA
jgi:predicted site-specific integrase-resolvase